MRRLILAFALFLQGGPQPLTVSIQNPSFEAPVNFSGSGLCNSPMESGPIPSWISTQNAGGSFGVIQWLCEPVPDGKAVAFLLNASISQDLGFAPQPGVYTLKVFFASWYYSYPGDYDVFLTIGGKKLCPTSSWAQGDFDEITLVCPIPGHIAVDHWNFPEGNLGISVSNSSTGWPTMIDKFSMTFTPSN